MDDRSRGSSFERPRAWSEPFDLDAFLNDPEPKTFRSRRISSALTLTDEEWDAFDRAIREGSRGK